MNDVTAVEWRGYQGFCYDSKVTVMQQKHDGERGVKHYQKLRDVIYV